MATASALNDLWDSVHPELGSPMRNSRLIDAPYIPTPGLCALCQIRVDDMLMHQHSDEVITAALAERDARERSEAQRGQLGLGCNDAIDTDWGRR